MTGETILRALASVRTRLWRIGVIRSAAWGLLGSACLVAFCGAVRLAGWASLTTLGGLALLAAGPIVGGIYGILRRPKWEVAARVTDAHYVLKDRAATALAFLRRGSSDRWELLQMDDAAAHLAQVDATAVLPFRWPRLLSCGLVAAAIAALLILWPLTPPPLQAAAVGPNQGLLAIAADLEKDVDELEEEATDRQDEELKELVKQLREQTEALREEGIEQKEALATLSEMQAALQQHAQYNAALVNAQLSHLAEAMASAEALQPTAEKLKAGEHQAAAQELENLEKVDASRRSEKAASERMNKLAEDMAAKGLGTMGSSVSSIAEGLSGGDSKKFCEGCKSLASQLRKHEARKALNNLMLRKLDKLSECKGQCSMCFGKCQGCKECDGNGQCEKNSLAEGLKPKKSDKPSNNFGKSTSGNVFGDKTDLASNGSQEQLTGQAGEGPSDVEVTTSPEGREQAGRAYKERYEKYRKLSEEVLDGEPIPLGHRQMIREYFELIRPNAGEDPALDAAKRHRKPERSTRVRRTADPRGRGEEGNREGAKGVPSPKLGEPAAIHCRNWQLQRRLRA